MEPQVAIEEQFGGDDDRGMTPLGMQPPPYKMTRFSNAYMLVYIRESDWDQIMCNVRPNFS